MNVSIVLKFYSDDVYMMCGATINTTQHYVYVLHVTVFYLQLSLISALWCIVQSEIYSYFKWDKI
jgi:hypothetical protein